MEHCQYRKYWKSNKEKIRGGILTEQKLIRMLQSHGCCVSRSATKSELVGYLEHRERNWPCYQACTEAELVDFFVNRRLLNKTDASRLSHAQLCKRLWFADNNSGSPTMDGPLKSIRDLPAELRVRIYEPYIDSFTEDLETVDPPPLGGVCRLIRKEFMPVFYDRAMFQFHMEPIRGDRYAIHPTQQAQSIVKAMQKTTEGQITRLRNVQLHAGAYVHPRYKGSLTVEVVQRLGEDGRSWVMNVRGSAREEAHLAVAGLVAKLVIVCSIFGKNKALDVEDIKGLFAIVQEWRTGYDAYVSALKRMQSQE